MVMRLAETRFFAADADELLLREPEPESTRSQVWLKPSSQFPSSPAWRLPPEETEYARDKRERANSSSYRGQAGIYRNRDDDGDGVGSSDEAGDGDADRLSTLLTVIRGANGVFSATSLR
jgi:hypothetical protein